LIRCRRSEQIQDGKTRKRKPEERRAALARLNKVMISGEEALDFSRRVRTARFPTAIFAWTKRKLFVETPIFDESISTAKFNLFSRESFDLTVQLGECYLDFENVSRLWNQERMLNLRLGGWTSRSAKSI